MSALKSPLPDFVLVTGNPGKRHEAARILGFEPPCAPLDLPEIQSLDLAEVLEAKAEEAWRQLGRPLVVDETGLELAALGGFPGPLVKWLLAAVGAAGLARIAHTLGNPVATARCLLLYRDGERRVIGSGATPGQIAPTPRGERGFGFDPVFIPEESELTYGEIAEVDKDALGHRGRAWRDLLRAFDASRT